LQIGAAVCVAPGVVRSRSATRPLGARLKWPRYFNGRYVK
jgi:hypothetical protein